MDNIETRLNMTARFFAGVTAAVSILAIMGWLTKNLALAEIRSSYIPMAPSTAVTFLILSAALMIAAIAGDRQNWRLSALIAVSLAGLVALILLVQYMSGFEIDIESVLIRRTQRFGRVRTGRMSPLTAAMFMLAAAGLLSLLRKNPLRAFSGIMGVLLGTAGGTILLGYLFGAPFLYGGNIIPVAFTTALAFAALATGLVAAAGESVWPLRALMGTGVKARILRAFLPLLIALVLGLELIESNFFPKGEPPIYVAGIGVLAVIITALAASVLSRTVGGAIERAEAERRRGEAEIYYITFHDTLTGLPNRDFVKDILERLIKFVEDEGRPVAIVHLNINGFKLINEAYGREIGDRVIKTQASRLSGAIKSEDTIARVGADEFIVILADTDTESAIKTANMLLEDFAAPIFIGQREIRTSASAGISLFPDDGSEAGKLMANAEAASRRAKAEGGNEVRFYTAGLQMTANKLLSLENELIHALERGEIILHYQPIFSCENGKICCIEALARWDHPSRGLLSPDKFILFAEESGLIVSMGAEIMRQACLQLKSWHGFKNLIPPAISVNVSAVQLAREGLAATIKDILSETGLSAEHLIIEVTESSIIHNINAAKSAMAHLTEVGASFAVDDFGTGYASLSTLINMPVQVVKIDRCFIGGMADDRKYADIVKTIITMSHNLNLRVVAEGVETADQLDLLSELKCDAIQGFLLSRPLPAEKMGALLRDNRDFLKKSA